MFISVIRDCSHKTGKALNRIAYWSNRAGAIAAAFAIMAPVLVGATGMALDLGQSFLVRQRLGGALDAAALAATASETDQDAIQDRVDEFMQVNYPDGKIGDLILSSIDVEVDGDDITVSASAQYDTSFMKILHIDTLNVAASTTIHRAIKGLEAVLVLDNTGSLQATNMDAVRTASKNFVNILFDRVQTATDIKIGVVPYASSVRIGYYGLGMVPDDTEFNSFGTAGTYAQYGDGTAFVTLPEDVEYTTNSSSSDKWYGCVVEHNDGDHDPATYDFTTANYVTEPRSYGQLWTTNPDSLCTVAECNGHGWDPSKTDNDPANYDQEDNFTGPWDIYMKGTTSSTQICTAYETGCVNEQTQCTESHQECTRYKNGSCKNWTTVCDTYETICVEEGPVCTTYVDGYKFNKDNSPNSGCPKAYIQPLTSDQTQLLAELDTMDYGGSTYSNIGMLWGLRLISPEAPFTEGAAWDDSDWQKAVVIMTDGEMSPNNNYSTYWYEKKTNVDSVATLNTRLKNVCTLLKSKGVIVYTINFKHATSDISETTKQVYKDCATQPWQDYYRFVETADELNDTFEEIATKLARLHISR